MRKIPLGSSSFSEILSDPDLFYVDKTDFIVEFLQESAKISLITRPRRFGKTLNLSMLRYFFDQKNAGENRRLFENLEIGQNQAAMSQQGSRPVIALTFKDCKARNWEDLQDAVAGLLARVAREHSPAFSQEIKTPAWFAAVFEKKASFEESFAFLANLMGLYHQKGMHPLLLIDEYDVPLQEAWQHGCWEEAIAFFRNFFSASFKDNPHIWRGVLTGCLRISRESMFTGLNNLKVYSVSSQGYSSHFGFTQEETVKALEEFGLSTHLEDVENWYNGYCFGKTTIYNPWSISCFLDNKKLQPYWVNTSGQQMEKSLLKKSNQDIKKELQILMSGGGITVNLQEQAVFENLERHPENFWNFLYQTGYLKAVALHLSPQNPRPAVELKIPNLEVQGIYLNSIQSWFIETQSQNAMIEVGKALQKGDAEEFSAIFQEIVTQSFSYFDVEKKNPESFYHAFILGMMVQFSNIWQIKSNREAGFGRADVLLIPKNPHDTTGVIFEFKRRRGKEDLEAAAQNALKQIQERQYAHELKASGCQEILEIGVGFSGKETAILIGP